MPLLFRFPGIGAVANEEKTGDGYRTEVASFNRGCSVLNTNAVTEPETPPATMLHRVL